MENISSLLQRKQPAGVYWLESPLPAAELEKLAKTAQLAFFHLEGEKLTSKASFLNHAALTLHFPEYFGANWDAFEDCMTDLEWLKATGYVLLYDHTDSFAQHAPEQFATALELLHAISQFWANQGKPMLVLLRGERRPPGIAAVG